MAPSPQFVAYEILNTHNMIDNYPKVYEAAYLRFHRGKLTNKLIKEIKDTKFQSEDSKKPNYLPKDLFSKLKIVMS